MGAIADALRRKYRTPADALRALGFNPREFGVAEPARGVAADYAHDRAYAVELADAPALKYPAAYAADKGEYQMPRFTRSRRFAYDDAEEYGQELLDVVKDPDSTFGEQLAALVEHAAERDPEGSLRHSRSSAKTSAGQDPGLATVSSVAPSTAALAATAAAMARISPSRSRTCRAPVARTGAWVPTRCRTVAPRTPSSSACLARTRPRSSAAKMPAAPKRSTPPPRSPERARLAVAVEAHSAAMHQLNRVREAQQREEERYFEELQPDVARAKRELAAARATNPRELVDRILGGDELPDDGMAVELRLESAQRELDAAERKLTASSEVRKLLRNHKTAGGLHR